MVNYVGQLFDDNTIKYYREVYTKYDEAGSPELYSVEEQLKEGEIKFPINFPELIDDLTQFKIIDNNLCDLDGNMVNPFNGLPNYKEIIDKDYATKYEWLYFAHQIIFHTHGYLIWYNPDLYYNDVVDEFTRINSVEALGDFVNIVPDATNIPVKISGSDNVEKLYNNFIELLDIEEPLHATLIMYSNEQIKELELMLDELIEAVRIYL